MDEVAVRSFGTFIASPHNRRTVHKPAVEPLSSSKMTFGFTAPVVHKSDLTKRGIRIDLEILDKEPNGNVKVLTSLYQDRASSARYKYTLDKFDGVYQIISVKYFNRDIF